MDEKDYERLEEHTSEEVKIDEDELQEDPFGEEAYLHKEIPVQKVKGKKIFQRVLALVLVAALSLGLGYGIGITMPNETVAVEAEPTSLIRVSTAFAEDGLNTVQVAEKVSPSVVAITSTMEVQNFYQTMTTEGQGSGVIYKVSDEDVLIITNNHVIEDAKEVIVELIDGTTATATLVGNDAETDLALLSLDSSQLTEGTLKAISPIQIGSSNNLLVGESVMAVGNALGYGRTVTVGVISAINRDLPLMNGRMDLIQTDAAINPGNSGGALVNSDGELIGINTIKIADTEVEGIGFALPSKQVIEIVEQLNAEGYISRPYLGIYGRNIDDSMSELYELPIGVIVMDIVESSGAANSDLMINDVIVKFNDQKINSMDDLVTAVEAKTVGDQVQLTVIRDGDQKRVIDVQLTERSEYQ